MNAPDFFQWARDRKSCVRGLLYIRGRSSNDFWNHCRRGDWLCWVLDWEKLPHPTNVPYWERPWWKLFLKELYGSVELNDKFRFEHFEAWDKFLHLTHDDTFMSPPGRKVAYGSSFDWDWEAATRAVKRSYPDPLFGKPYKPFSPVTSYAVEEAYPEDYRNVDKVIDDHLKDLGKNSLDN